MIKSALRGTGRSWRSVPTARTACEGRGRRESPPARLAPVTNPAGIEALTAERDFAAATVRSRMVRLPALTARAGAGRFRPGRSPRDEPCARAP